MRVHEIAKEVNVPSKDLVEKLQAKGIDVKNHMSTLSEKDVNIIRETFSGKPVAEKPAAKAPETENKAEGKAEVKEIARDVRPTPPQEADRNRKPAESRPRPEGRTVSFRDEKPAPRPMEGRPRPEGQQRPPYQGGQQTGDRPQRPPYQGGQQGGDRPQRPPYQGGQQTGDRPQRPPYQGGQQGGDRPQRPPYQGGQQTGDRPQRPPYQGGDRPQRPPYQGGDRPQRPPYQGGQQTGDRPQRPPYQGGDRPQRPPYQGGDRPQRPPYQGGDRPQRPPYQGQGGDRPQRPPYQGGAGGSKPPYGGQKPGFGTGPKPPFKSDKKPGPGKDFRGAEPAAPEKVEKDTKSNYGNRKRDKLKDTNIIEKREHVSLDKVFRPKKKGGQQAAPRKTQIPAPEVKRHVVIEDELTVQELASQLGKKSTEIIKSLMGLGIMATINQSLDPDTIQIIAEEFGATFEKRETKEERLFAEIEDAAESLMPRPPVVTIMGHVDHGKTSLLDKIRSANVTASEAGGITQHIGAYQVTIKKQKITFLDTPGHEAFTQMRARGAQITDISILVVAADDGVMPQTIEAIHHAKAAKVPIIVAINKIDKPGANPDRIKQELTEHGLLAEDWGGDVIMVPVSAMTGEGIENLLEMILLVAEVAELRSNPDRKAAGVVIESKLDKGRGSVATLLVQKGTLEIGDFLIAGTTMGKVRAMFDYTGRKLKKATPSMPVEVLGLSDVPEAGDEFLVAEDEKLAKDVVERKIKDRHLKDLNKGNRVTLDDVFAKIKDGEIKDLNIILKADVQGSIEAIKQSLDKLSNEEVRVNVIHSGVGGIKETDVMLASASNAIIIGFNVRPDVNSRKIAEKEAVDIRSYRIIYDAIEDVKAALSGLLSPEIKEKDLGVAEIRMVIRVPKVGNVAGIYITEGKFTRNARVRVLRDSVVIFDGSIDALKRFKDDVKEVQTGYECGVSIKNYNDFREGDILEAYEMQEIKRELE